MVADGPKVYAGIAVTLGLALIIGAFTWTILRAKNAVHVDADEGGVRIRGRDRIEWVSYRSLTHASTRTTFGRVTLQLDNRAFALADLHTPAQYGVIQGRVHAARRRQASPQATSLARGGRALDVWLSSLEGGEGYRSLAISNDELLEIALDRNADVEIRAAAVYKVLRGRDEEAKARVMETVHPLMPPLVLLMVSLGVRPGQWVAGLDEADDFLAREDVEAANRIKESRLRVRVAAGEELLADEGPSEEQNEEQRRQMR